MRRAEGASVNVATLCTTVHVGTHVDGPLHFQDGAPAVGHLPLQAYLGPARVIDARGRDALDADLVDGIDLAAEERVLFRSRESVDATAFPKAFAALTPALAQRLAEAGVKLVGTDAPSVDPADSKDLAAHRALGAGGVAILENAVLTDVAPGRYTLIALPLRLTEADSSPVRAVLLELPAGAAGADTTMNPAPGAQRAGDGNGMGDVA